PFGGSASVGGNHVIKLGDLQIKVTDNRIVHRMALGLFDILGPFFVIPHWIDVQTAYFKIFFFKLRLKTRHIATFGVENWGEILWMGKKNRPSVANPFMKIDGSFRRLRGKIGSFLSNMERHTFSPFN